MSDGVPSTSLNPATAELVPDPLNHGWRDDGLRVGFGRLLDTFDRHGAQLHADADAGGSGRVFALALHPFAIGQAFRTRYLDEALEHVANHPDVWLTTSDEIAEHYLTSAGDAPTTARRAA